jgi:hypothetical protein
VANKPNQATQVSPNNPCPFLRALVSEGLLADDVEPLEKVAATIVEVARAGDGKPDLPSKVIFGIALIANGLSPSALLKSKRQGLRLNALRGGPLDKQGAGSGILDKLGVVNEKDLARFKEFSSTKTTADGSSEPGLSLAELRTYMDTNFARAAGRRRRVDRALMNGEWPVLLKVMGKDGPDGRYLSLAELKVLFKQRRLPTRMTKQLRV